MYIPPSADTKDALNVLYQSISDLQSIHLDRAFIGGDSNQVNNYYQHLDFATRRANTVDLAITNMKNSFKAVPRPQLCSSDHTSVLLIPAYRPLLNGAKPSMKKARTRLEGAISALQDCFDCND